MTKEYDERASLENINFKAAITEEDKEVVLSILDAAEKVGRSISRLSQSRGHADFILSISQKGNFPISTHEYGQVENYDEALVYSHLNIESILNDPDAVSSSEKDGSPYRIGAIAFGKWIISVHGFDNPKMNAAVALGIGFGAHLISYEDAETLAHNQANCLSEYMENEDALTEPFFKDISTSKGPLLPPQRI